MIQHVIVMLGRVFARCSCGWVSVITQPEREELSRSKADDLLLDRHNAHAAARKEQGR